MNPDKTGKFIYKLRTEKGLSQYQLADMIPISRQAVSKWERGESIPDSSTLMRLSDIFEVTINELLKGERLKTNSIKQLEETTLEMLDENNKKQRIIKRNLITSITIITVLLLGFLSYYFINSYNSTKVYSISGDKNLFKTYNGIFITTKERTYLKLGKLKYNDDIEVNNIKLYYKTSTGKKKLLAEDTDIDNVSLMELTGYQEKVLGNKPNIIMNSTYLEITYNGDQKETIKLEYKRLFRNNRLFYTKIKMQKVKVDYTKDKITSVVVGKEITDKKEEEKDKETEETPKADSPTGIVSENILKEEIATEIKKEVDITSAINKIKTEGMDLGGTYYYEVEGTGIAFMYFESQDQLKMMENDADSWDYISSHNKYLCTTYSNEECKNYINDSIINYLN